MSEIDDRETLLSRFESDGFVVVPRFLVKDVFAQLLDRLGRFLRDVVPVLSANEVFYEDKNNPATLKQIQHLDQHDPWFHQLFHQGPLREMAESLLSGPVVPQNMQYFNKPPKVGQPTPPHQDGFYFMLDPCEAITMWLALDEVDEGNGCVRYVRGSHRLGLRKHARTGTLGFSQGIVGYPLEEDRSAESAMPAEPGDLLIHDALTIHRADRNRSSTRSRRALGFIYYSVRAQQDAEKHAAYQRDLAEELKSRGKI